jgi:hypothetical protein
VEAVLRRFAMAVPVGRLGFSEQVSPHILPRNASVRTIFGKIFRKNRPIPPPQSSKVPKTAEFALSD